MADFEILTNQLGGDYGVKHMLTCVNSDSLVTSVSKFIPELDVISLIELGSVYLNNMRLKNDVPLNNGDILRIHSLPRRFKAPQDLGNRIVFQNDDILIFNKPFGSHLHATVDNLQENIVAWFRSILGISIFITHRIDFETSGLVIFAKNLRSQSEINELFRGKTISRSYMAISHKPLSIGRYVHYMIKSPKAPKTIISIPHPKTVDCVLNVHSSEPFFTAGGNPAFSHLVSLDTGRPQQIRAQFAYMDCPLLNDSKYSGIRDQTFGPETKIGLFSRQLSLIFKNEVLSFELPLEEILK